MKNDIDGETSGKSICALSQSGSRIGIYPPLNKVKLDKLVYYAQAYWLAQKNEQLFDDCEILTELMGPVVDGLPKVSEMGKGTIDGIPNQEAKFLKGIHDALKKYSGLELSDITREPGEPHSFVWSIECHPTDSKPATRCIIPTNLIHNVFSYKLAQMQLGGGNVVIG